MHSTHLPVQGSKLIGHQAWNILAERIVVGLRHTKGDFRSPLIPQTCISILHWSPGGGGAKMALGLKGVGNVLGIWRNIKGAQKTM